MERTTTTEMEAEAQREAAREGARRRTEIIQRLRRSLKNKDLVIIVGAGITLNATADESGRAPARLTWTGLIRNGLDYLVEERCVEASNRRLRHAYISLTQNETDCLLDAADIMTKQMRNAGKFPTWLESVFQNLNAEVRQPAILEVLSALHERGATMVTTNYDDLLETACDVQRIGTRDQNDLLRFKRRDLDGVLHVHGSYLDPDEVVLDTTDYYQVTHSDEVQNILRTFLEWKTILFVGCGSGLEDPNFGTLLNWAGERQENIPNRHCLLIRDNDTLNHRLLLRLKYGQYYHDLIPFLSQILDLPAGPANPITATGSGSTNAGSQLMHFLIPSLRNDHFVGRASVFDDLNNQLFLNGELSRKAALCGLGGIGKTQIALEYAYRLKQESRCSIFWIYASSIGKFEESVQQLARHCEIPGHQDPKDVLQLVQTWLENVYERQWLMIIDNVDDMRIMTDKLTSGKCLLEYLPRTSQGSILYTSRNRDIGIDLVGKPIDVSVMNGVEARALLSKKLINTDASTEEMQLEFLEEMGFLPLAVTQAAAYATKRRMTVPQYLELFRRSDTNRSKLIGHAFIDHGRESRPMESLAKTWTMSFNYIKDQSTRASKMLALMSFFDRNDIPNSLLIEDGEEKVDFLEGMAYLEAFSLVDQKADADVHYMHRLVQLATRVWIHAEGNEDSQASLAISRLSERFPGGDFENWPTCELYLPHVDAVLRYEFKSQSDEVKATKALLLLNTSDYLQAQGKFPQSIQRAQQSIELRESVLGPQHEDTLKSMNRLARALTTQGEYKSAEVVARKTLKMRIDLFGAEHEESLNSADTLARLCFYQGQFGEAEKTSKRVADQREKILGPKHPNTLNILSFHGWMLRHQYQYQEAKSEISAACKLQREIWGVDHPDTLESLGRLAIVELDLGKADIAEDLLQNATSKFEKVYGKEHPETYAIWNNLAVILSSRGKWDESANINQRVLMWKETTLGKRHPETLITASNLALNLRDLGKRDEAASILTEVFEARRKVIGEHHIDTLRTGQELAYTFQVLQRLKSAENLYRDVVKARINILGEKDWQTMDTQIRLASVVREQGRMDEARKISQDTLTLQEKFLSNKHPDVLILRNNLAHEFQEQKNFDQAEKLYWLVLEDREEVLGAENTETLLTCHDLAFTLHSREKYDASEKMYRRTLEAQEKVLGPKHPFALTCRNNLAVVLHDQKKYDEAIKYYEQTLQDRTGVLGEKHPHTLVTRINIASALYGQEKYKEAESAYRATLVLQEEAVGEKDRGVLSTYNDLGNTLYGQEKYKEAEQFYRKSFVGRQEVLGEDAVETMITCNNLANSLFGQDRYEEAEIIYRQTLTGRRKVLGEKHADTLTSYNNLASDYFQLGKYEQAEELYRKALVGRQKYLGATHESTLNTGRSLALTLEKKNKHRKADTRSKGNGGPSLRPGAEISDAGRFISNWVEKVWDVLR